MAQAILQSIDNVPRYTIACDSDNWFVVDPHGILLKDRFATEGEARGKAAEMNTNRSADD